MIAIVDSLHILICLVLIIIILLQQGKGADVGAVFGGSSQTMFGANREGTALGRMTYALGALFFATSIFLAYAGARRATGSIFEGVFSHPSSVMPAKLPKAPAPVAPAGSTTPAKSK